MFRFFYPNLSDVVKWFDYKWLEINMKWGKYFKWPAVSYLVEIYCATDIHNLTVILLIKSKCEGMSVRAMSPAWHLGLSVKMWCLLRLSNSSIIPDYSSLSLVWIPRSYLMFWCLCDPEYLRCTELTQIRCFESGYLIMSDVHLCIDFILPYLAAGSEVRKCLNALNRTPVNLPGFCSNHFLLS